MATSKSNLGANIGDVVVLYHKILQVASDIQGLDVDWFSVTSGFEWKVQLLRERIDFYEQDEARHVFEKPVDNSIVEMLKRAEESLKIEERKLSLLQEGTRSDRCCSIFSQICVLVAKVSTISLPERLEITLGEVLNVMATSKSNLGANIGDVVVLYHKILQVASDIQGLDDWFSVTSGFEWKVQLLRERIDFYKQDEGRHVYEKPVDNSIVERLKRAEESLKIEERKLSLLQEGTRSDRCCSIFSQICILVAKVSTIALPERLEITLGEVLNVMATSKSNLGANIGDVVVLYHKIFQVASDIQGLHVDWFSVTSGFEWKVQLLRERIDFYEQDEARHVFEKPVDNSIVEMLKRAEVSLNIEERKLRLLHEGTHCCGVFSHWCVLVAKGSTISLPAKLEVTLGEVLNVMGTSESVLKMEGETADWSLVATMLDGFKKLETADAKVLLFLIYACKEGPVPGEVLRNLYYATKSSRTFSLSIKELRAKKLVDPRPSTLAPEMWKGKERTDENLEESLFSVTTQEQLKIGPREIIYGDWFMPSAVKRCITDKDEIRYVLGVLFGGDQSPVDKHDRSSETEVMEKEKARVTKALCNLYFDSALIEQVVIPVTTSASNLVHPDVMKAGRWRAIEPLIWLLDQPTDKNKWTESDLSCVRKVLLKYVHEGQLDDANISVLLELRSYPMAPLATLATIAKIFSKEGRPLLNDESHGFLKTLVNLLDSKELNLRAAAATALLCITRKAKKDKATFIVANMPGILAMLVRSIQDYDLVIPPHGAHELSLNATRILWSLGGMEIIKLKICSEDKAIESLVQSLARDDSPSLQQCAAGALWRLACGGEAAKLKIVNESGALAGLVKSLSKIKNPTLQEYVAGALMSLATGGELIKSRIVNEDGALQTIVKCLSIPDNANLEKNLTTVLENLTFGGESIIQKILENDWALAALAKSLSKDDNPILQETAASALLNLAVGGEAIKYKVLTGNGVLTNLVRSLTKDHNPVVESAARALWSLTYGGKLPKLTIAKCILNQDRALKCLVQALSKDDEPMLQQHVALVLGNIATTKIGSQAIVGTEEALASLVKSLSKKVNPSLQGNAAGALWILAAQGETNKVLNEKGAIAGLVGFISNHDNLNVSRNAIGALLALAARGKVSDLSKEEGALDALKRFLSQDDHSTLQHKATRDLFNQAIGGESTKSKIREDLEIWDKDGVASESSKGFDSERNTLEKEKIKEAIIHCALYFDQVSTHIMVEAAINQARHAHEVIHSNDPINDQRRKTLEPLMPLLDQPKEEEEHNQVLDQPQEEEEQNQVLDQPQEHNQKTDTNRARCVKQVFLKYVCEGQLDDKIFDLLKLEPLVTLKAITNIFSKEEGPLLNSNGQKLLDDVKPQLLGSNDDSQRGVQEAASEALLHIFRKYMKEDPTFVVENKPGISGMLLRSIQDSLRRKQSHTLASNAAKILCLLGCSLIYTPK